MKSMEEESSVGLREKSTEMISLVFFYVELWCFEVWEQQCEAMHDYHFSSFMKTSVSHTSAVTNWCGVWEIQMLIMRKDSVQEQQEEKEEIGCKLLSTGGGSWLHGAQVCLTQIYFDVFHDFIYLMMRFLHLQMDIAHCTFATIISTLLFLNGKVRL